MNEGPGFFEEAKRRVQAHKAEQLEQQRLRNQATGGCIAAAIICTLMVCVTALIIVWMVYV